MAFLLIWSSIKNFLQFIPAFVWKWLAIGLAILAIFFYGQNSGKRIAKAQCEQAAKLAQTAANDQDLQAEKDGRAQDLEITNALTQQKQVDNATIEALKIQLAKRTPAAVAKCLYDKSNSDPDAGVDPDSVRLPIKRPAKAGARH